MSNPTTLPVRRYAIVMAGGIGERFWPLSSKTRPKQLLRLTPEDGSMLEGALKRAAALTEPKNVVISTTEPLREVIYLASGLPQSQVIAEPDKRNTLGALVYVAAHLAAIESASHDRIVVGVLASDHWIGDADRFTFDASRAMDLALDSNAIVTMGIPPTRSETGYGYLEIAQECVPSMPQKVTRFHEKPNRERAEAYVQSGRFLWNSGMFFFTLRTFLEELACAQPRSFEIFGRLTEAMRTGDHQNTLSIFREIEDISIDFAVMERARNVMVIPASFPWDDVGAFDALSRSFKTDENDNIVVGNVVAINCHRCILYNDSNRVLATSGLEGILIVQTNSETLSIPVAEAQTVREVSRAVFANSLSQST